MSTIQATEGLSRIQDAQLTLRGTEAEAVGAASALTFGELFKPRPKTLRVPTHQRSRPKPINKLLC